MPVCCGRCIGVDYSGRRGGMYKYRIGGSSENMGMENGSSDIETWQRRDITIEKTGRP